MTIGHIRVTRLGIYDRHTMARSIAVKLGADYKSDPSYFLLLADRQIEEMEDELSAPGFYEEPTVIPENRALVITAIASLVLMIITLI